MTGYELREDFAARAQNNVRAFLGEEIGARYSVEVRDSYEGIDPTGLDRIVLDLPEPWQVVKHAEGALRTGGILVAYTPSITQAMQLREALADERVRAGRDDRSAQPRVAHRGPGGATRSPHGGPHGIPHPRAVDRELNPIAG